MKYRYLAAMTVFAFIFAASAAAQNKAANFAGTWELDLSKSKLGERGGMIESQTLTVTQTDKEITIQTATKRTPPPADAAPNTRGGGRMGGGGFGRGFGGGDSATTYALDGKETKAEIEGRMGKIPVTLKAKADGSKLQLSSSSTFTGQMGDVTMTTKEKWELSSDGKTLTVETERSSPRGSESTTKVFTKKS
jgi:hypothetical protein